MANKLCYPMFEVQDTHFAKIKVQSGQTLYPGDVVYAEVLDTAITDNIEVYAPTPLSNVTTQVPCIIINQGYEKTTDDRRIEGNPDYSTYSYTEGDTLTVVRLHEGQVFQISDDCLDNTGVVVPVAGVKLIAQNSDVNLATAASGGTNKVVLNIDYRNSIGIGGNMGMTYIDTNIARVEG